MYINDKIAGIGVFLLSGYLYFLYPLNDIINLNAKYGDFTLSSGMKFCSDDLIGLLAVNECNKLYFGVFLIIIFALYGLHLIFNK